MTSDEREHLPVQYRPQGADRTSIPAEVCEVCSDFATGALVPAGFCEQARAVIDQRDR